MVVPIISNGILVFIIQSIFQSRLKHNEHKDEVKRKINSELFSLLLESKNNFRALGHCLTDHPESTELFNQNLGKFNFGIRKLLDYYNDYSFYLSNYSSIIQRLESTYNEYIAFGRSRKSQAINAHKFSHSFLSNLRTKTRPPSTFSRQPVHFLFILPMLSPARPFLSSVSELFFLTPRSPVPAGTAGT